MRIAIIGSGIAGLVCAHRLRREHDVTLFESRDRLGGHTHTVMVDLEGTRIPVDTGFIVFNRNTYPCFGALLDELGVSSAPTEMSFSFRCDERGLEYGGRSLAGIFAQRRNVVRPRFLRMLRDVRRFGRVVVSDASSWASDLSLGEYLDRSGLSRGFIDDYLLPMAGSIWSAPPDGIRGYPLRSFVAFFENHGMLRPWRAPRWRYVEGGSSTYVRAIDEELGDRVRLSCPVSRVERGLDGVVLAMPGGASERFDEVVLACHSDQALAILADPTRAERAVLGAIGYRSNEAVLHTDPSLLPRRRSAWSAWNFHTFGDDPDRVSVTYQMNILQRLPLERPVSVTLNATSRIDPASVLGTFRYDHPVYTRRAVDAQRRWGEVSGVNRTHYCGAYWGYGFHEDGTRSGLRVCDAIGRGAREEAAA